MSGIKGILSFYDIGFFIYLILYVLGFWLLYGFIFVDFVWMMFVFASLIIDYLILMMYGLLNI
jgi:hypothetical protein